MFFSGASDNNLPDFKITVNSTPLPQPIAKSVMEIIATEYMSPPNSFSVLINDPKLELIDPKNGVFTEGSRIEISLGYMNKTRKMLTGEISFVSADFSNAGATSVRLEGFDLLHRLSRGTCYRVFEGPSANSGIPDSQIVSQIASEMKLSPVVDTTPERNEPRVQEHVSNLAFVEELARLSGYYLWAEEDKLFFKNEFPAPNTIDLEWGVNLLNFNPRLSTVGLVNEVEVRGWDMKQKEGITSTAKRSSASLNEFSSTGSKQISEGSGGKSRIVVVDSRISSQEDADAYAKTLISEQQQNITGTGSCIGEPEIRAGTILNMKKVGRFSGEYIVEKVNHTFGSNGYHTQFQVRKKT